MRKSIKLQQEIWSINISDIEFDLKSRDEITKLLIGFQHIYNTPEVLNKIFDILKEIIPEGTSMKNGRPGMNLWNILVLGTLRLNCDWDYDKVKEIADNHINLRQMLQHDLLDRSKYPLQTIKDNLMLFTPEVLDKINQIVVATGHTVMGKQLEDKLKGQCDSFVVKTDVHHPTDTNLLWDAMRKIIKLIAVLCSHFEITTWRQHHKNLQDIKKLFNYTRRLNKSKSKIKSTQLDQEEAIKEAHRDYIDLASEYIKKAKMTILDLRLLGYVPEASILEIEEYIMHAERQIDQIERRVINEETIPHAEKVFSIFQPHTEWISKGKAGVPRELGLNVCIVKDQFGFILHHRVMQNETDEKITIPITVETKERFPTFNSCSYDKGFYSPGHREKLNKIIDTVILPKKGKLSLEESKIENSEEFIQGRKNHPAVESAISALDNHGLDLCRDHGIDGFERYVGLGVLARNIQILGHMIQQKEHESQKRRAKYKKTWNNNRLAA